MLKKLSFLTCVGLSVLTSTAFSQITVDNSASASFGNVPMQLATYELTEFDAGSNTKLVVGFGVENGTPSSFAVTFGGVPLTAVQTSTDGSGVESTAIFFLDGANGVGDVVVTTGPGPGDLFGNGPGFYVVALTGAAPGFETSGTIGDGERTFGDLTGTLTGISDGAYVMAAFADQGRDGDQMVTGDLMQVSEFSGANMDQIGSAVCIVASGLGNGSDLSITFNDLGAVDNDFQNRANASYASFAVGDGGDGGDVTPFIGLLSGGGNQAEADLNEDGMVDFLDITPFIRLLSGG